MYVADALWIEKPGDKPEKAKFGYLSNDLKKNWDRGEGTEIAQLYGLVIPGLILARHIFKGLDRPLYCDGNEHGDCDKRIYTWKPRHDFIHDAIKKAEMRILSPTGKVFAVIVAPNIKHKEKYPDIKAWIDRWVWVDEDEGLNEASVNWVDRYESKIWTRGESHEN